MRGWPAEPKHSAADGGKDQLGQLAVGGGVVRPVAEPISPVVIRRMVAVTTSPTNTADTLRNAPCACPRRSARGPGAQPRRCSARTPRGRRELGHVARKAGWSAGGPPPPPPDSESPAGRCREHPGDRGLDLGVARRKNRRTARVASCSLLSASAYSVRLEQPRSAAMSSRVSWLKPCVSKEIDQRVAQLELPIGQSEVVGTWLSWRY